MDHTVQQKICDAEHAHPQVLKQMDVSDPSSGVVKFWEWLAERDAPRSAGIEMGCGKGRNAIWLAQRGVDMSAFDFSPHAISEAQRRAGDDPRMRFSVGDATEQWPYASDYFDFGVDCFASTDIESREGRRRAAEEMFRVLKRGGYVLAYLLSTDDEFHKEMVQRSPARERNAFFHSTGKFEKTFDEQDITETYHDFEVVEARRVIKTTEFFGKHYGCKHHWVLFRKP